MKKKSIMTIIILCMGIFAISLNGCGKKDDESTAIAITPTPSEPKDEATETPTPAASANAAAVLSNNGTNTPMAAAGVYPNNGISANTAGNANKITGTIVAASMNDVTVRTSEGAEYICSTTNAVNNLNNGITLGNSITVTLSSMSAVNGVYTATELNDISSSQAGTSTSGGTGTSGYTGTDSTDNGTGYVDNGTYGYDETYEDYSGYSDGSDDYYYDDGSTDYYYYDPADEVYDDSYSYY